jgi:hypothetical protein
VVSPHWMIATQVVDSAEAPTTIHDLGGFAPALYQTSYQASCHQALVKSARQALVAAPQNRILFGVEERNAVELIRSSSEQTTGGLQRQRESA